MYRDGTGVSQDYSEAFQLFLKAAEQYRYPAAQYNVGVAYYEGKGRCPRFGVGLHVGHPRFEPGV